MILLTKLNGDGFILNGDFVLYVESCPDTLITLTTGATLLVRETLDEVVRRAVAYQQAKQLLPKPEYAAEYSG
ncbi:MAG: flagellar FlbD family protein [Planctomycetaceae bacterium]|jgi:flagellar protein FlbD|nr:flagellar FlbD family protein [Planctomycetaceae bacterium]